MAIPANGAASTAARQNPSADPSQSQMAAEWRMATPDQQQFGPVAKSEMDEWSRQGRIDATCQLHCTGWSDWKPAYEIYPHLRPAPSISTTSSSLTTGGIDDFLDGVSEKTPKPNNSSVAAVATSHVPSSAPTSVSPELNFGPYAQMSATSTSVSLPLQIGLRICSYGCWIILAGSVLYALEQIVVKAAPPNDPTSIKLLPAFQSWGTQGLVVGSLGLVTGWFVCRSAGPTSPAQRHKRIGFLALGAALLATLMASVLSIPNESDLIKTLLAGCDVARKIGVGVSAILLVSFLARTVQQVGQGSLAWHARLFSLAVVACLAGTFLEAYCFTLESPTLSLLLQVVKATALVGMVVWLTLLVRWTAKALDTA